MAIKRTFRNAKFAFTNFSGKRFDDDKRTCTLKITDEDLAQELIEEGWAIKEENYNDQHYWTLKVRVRFDIVPPKIKLIKEIGDEKIMTKITEANAHRLDNLSPKKVDLTISQYNWKNMGKTGVTAYLDIMYFTIDVPELEADYEDYDDSDFEFPREDGDMQFDV